MITADLTARVRDRLAGTPDDDSLQHRVSVLVREEAPLLTSEAHASTVAKVQTLPVSILVNAEVNKIHGDGRVAGVEVTVRGEPPRMLPAETVVAALGFTADLGPLANWGLQLDKRHILVDSTMATNLPRVFAAGDITEYPGKVRLIAVGFGEVATAVNNAAIVIDPAAHLFPGHSSDAG